MSARIALSLASAAVIIAGSWGCGGERLPPNVLLVTIDTLRADYLGSYGFPYPSSPYIDALAEQGVLFERAIAASSTTSPSHASILTSRRTREHSVGYLTGYTVLQDAPTLAEFFREAGFATAGFVGNLNLQRRLGFDRGFDHYDDEFPSAERRRPKQHERIAELTFERARAWIETQPEGPFFLWVHFQDPHGPYDPPAEYLGRIAIPGQPGEPSLRFLDTHDGIGGVPRYQALEGVTRLSEYRSRYAEEILYADRYVGELVDQLDDHPSRRPAVVLVTSDHGEAMGEDNVYFAHNLSSTPPLAHVPMILRAPGLPRARRSEPVGHVDVMPTLLELAGIAPPADARGLALGPYLRDGRPLPDRIVYCDAGEELSAYRADGFVRVGNLSGAWKGDARPLEPGWGAYRWTRDGVWTRFSDEARQVQRAQADYEEIRRYYETAVPMVSAEPADPQHLEHLRALGYAQ